MDVPVAGHRYQAETPALTLVVAVAVVLTIVLPIKVVMAVLVL